MVIAAAAEQIPSSCCVSYFWVFVSVCFYPAKGSLVQGDGDRAAVTLSAAADGSQQPASHHQFAVCLACECRVWCTERALEESLLLDQQHAAMTRKQFHDSNAVHCFVVCSMLSHQNVLSEAIFLLVLSDSKRHSDCRKARCQQMYGCVLIWLMSALACLCHARS